MEEIKTTAKSLLVIYVNVGSLPPFKAEAYLDRVKDHFSQQQKSWKLPDDVGVVFFPVRPPDQTLVDHIHFDYPTQDAINNLQDLRNQWVEFMNHELVPVCEECQKPHKKSWWQWLKSLFSPEE